MATKKNINRKNGVSASSGLAYKKTATPLKPASGDKMMKIAKLRPTTAASAPSTKSARTASTIKKKVY